MVEGCRTGYFQFDSRNDGLYIIVYPPQNGGRTANIDDVMYYLDKKKIECDTAGTGSQGREQYEDGT